MTIIGLLLTAFLVLVLVLFAISNAEPVVLQFWPFDVSWELPLAGAVLGAAALAFLLGAVLTWGGALHYRRRARRMQRAAQLLEAELAEIRAKQEAANPVPVPASATPSKALATTH